MTNVYEGQTATISEEFLDDFDQVILPRESTPAPLVRLFDTDKTIIAEVYAKPDPKIAGTWVADIPIPNMDLRDTTKFVAKWSFESDEGVHTAKTTIMVEPATMGRESDIVILCGHDSRMQVTIPTKVKLGVAERKADLARAVKARPAKEGDSLSMSLYYNNKAVFEALDSTNTAVKIETSENKTLIDMPAVVGKPAMAPMSLIVKHKPTRKIAETSYTYKVWAVTPQILLAARQLEDFIDKARIANIIPELEYTQGDLLEFLTRGLMYFNALQPVMTAFTGTNMQGPLMNCWLVCSSQYALGAQAQAEGALAFDFGGQTVSLNIDRTPAIEAALGRIDAEIEGMVKPYKKLLGKTGVLDGDGSQGGKFIDGSSHMGVLGLSNTPLTRIGRGRSGMSSSFYRSFF
jgi:hypothetical protein